MKKIMTLFLLSSFITLSGCQSWKYSEDPQYYVKDKAIKRAEKKLEEFSEKHHLSTQNFKGPYLNFENRGIDTDYPIYTVCYKQPPYYFCYDDWSRDGYADKLNLSEIEGGSLFDWLEKQ